MSTGWGQSQGGVGRGWGYELQVVSEQGMSQWEGGDAVQKCWVLNPGPLPPSLRLGYLFSELWI